MFWRCGTSIPVPLASKASALPFELHPSALKALSVLVNNIHWVLFFNLPQLTTKHNSRSLRKMFWRCGSSIHVPLACKASALPHELHPHTLHALSYLVNKGAWILVFDRHNLQRKIRFEDLGKCFGDAAHRSPYLSRAKRVLYHLSYITVLFSLRAKFWTNSMEYHLSICKELSISSHYQQTQNRIVEAWEAFWSCGTSIPVPLACKASALQFELHPRILQALS